MSYRAAAQWVGVETMSYPTKAALSNGLCPHCGQPMPQIRCGVRLYPMTARVFDIIKSGGTVGVSGSAILQRAYAGMKKPSWTTLKAHIWQARVALQDTDYRIISERDGPGPGTYRLVKVVKVLAFETVSSP